jgi:hypothetical protein
MQDQSRLRDVGFRFRFAQVLLQGAAEPLLKSFQPLPEPLQLSDTEPIALGGCGFEIIVLAAHKMVYIRVSFHEDAFLRLWIAALSPLIFFLSM